MSMRNCGVEVLTNWGQAGVPLLPKTLREFWTGERLPDWIARECRLPEGSTLAALDARVWDNLLAITPRIERYVLALLDTRYDAICEIPAIGRPWPIGLDPGSIPWRARTWNCLTRANLHLDRGRLSRLSFGELYAIKGMGAVSVVDFATTAEAAINRFEAAAEKEGKDVSAMVASVSGESWVEAITPDDPRFARYFEGWEGADSEFVDIAQADADAAALSSSFDLSGLTDVLALLGLRSRDALRSLLVRVGHIQQMPLDVALRDYVEALRSGGSGRVPDPARVDMLLARFGLDGTAEPVTLQEGAERLNVTRERFRQIQEAALKWKPDHPVYLPALDRALETLGSHAPMAAQAAAQLLVQQGITTVPFRPESVLAAAKFCGRAPTFTIEPGRHDARVVTDSSLEFASLVSSLASRLATASGASNVSAVIAAADAEGIQINAAQVREVLSYQTSAEFLDGEQEWFWMPRGIPTRNRLTNTTRRMLAVASPLDIRTIREGVQRLYHHRNRIGGPERESRPLMVPPRSILTAFYACNPAFTLEDGTVRPIHPLDYRAVLGETEQVMVEVLRSTPSCILDRHSLYAACEARGMNSSTFNAYLSFSPIIEHIDTGIWGLRGVHIDPVEVERLRTELAMRPRERRVLDFGWTAQGNLWIAVRLPNLGGSSFTLGIPAAIQLYVANRAFSAVGDDGSQVGIIAIDDHGTSWGYSPFLSRAGADEDDVLYVEFDLGDARATLRLEDAEFLEAAADQML